MNWLINLDHLIFILINSTLSNSIFDIIMPVITDQHNWYFPIAIISIIFIARERKTAILVIVVTIVAAGLTDPFCSQILKPLFHRLRPCHPSYFVGNHHVFLDGCNFMYGMKTSFSLPSCHAANVFAMATVLTLFYPSYFLSYAIVAIMVSYSRVYVGVHYPIDVMFGALVGTVIGMGVFYTYYYFKIMLMGKPIKYCVSNDETEN